MERILGISLLLFALSSCEVLEGPGDNARIIPNSEQIAAADLPLEHRGAAVPVLPDVFSIPRGVTQQLGVDLFFSLFFVFLNNQFDTAPPSQEFTIFAPAGLPTREAARWLSAEERLTEELLLSHVVMGEHLRPELLAATEAGAEVRTTLGGLEVAYSLDEDGELWVNDVKVVAWRQEGSALIVALEDYLFKQEIEQEVKNFEVSNELFPDTSEDDEEEEVWGEDRGDLEIAPQPASSSSGELVPSPRTQAKRCSQVENKSGLAIFRTITVCTETETGLANNSAAATAAARRIDSGPAAPLLRDLETQLTFLRGGPGLRYFLTYANSTGLARLLSTKRSYTLLAPVDEAFQRWQPIDWGFNPFLVEAFLEELMANLVIEGAVSLEESDSDGKLRSFTTLGGGEVRLRTKGENIYLEDSLVLGEDREDSLVLGELPLAAGTVLFLDRVPGLDQARLELLRETNSHLETFPPKFNGSVESLNNGSTILLKDITTTRATVDETTEESSTTTEAALENEEFFSLDESQINFPVTALPGSAQDLAGLGEGGVRFPANTTVTRMRSDGSRVRFYNRTLDTSASLVVLRLKQLLSSELGAAEAKGEGGGEEAARHTRVVYINNQRVELEAEAAS